ncbi:MAG: tetratricopeptide repeat protein, partial [Candidatus Latescibacteria bacterium]|nr:tetratricopeptide repeat protein [Candidatus Latescibacterota bacterium]
MKQLISKTIWISAILLGFMTVMAPAPIEAKVTKGQASIAKRSAKLYLRQRQYDKALENYLVAAEGRPGDLEVHYNIGTIYSRKELYDDMNKHFAIIEEAKKNKKWLKRIDAERKTLWRQHYNIGVQALNAQKSEYAIEQFNTAIKVDERESDAYEGIGIAYLNIGKTEEGIQAYRSAIEKNPKKSQSYYNLSVALTNQGTLESQREALTLLQKGHELAPKDLQILQQMALLFNRQGDNVAAGEA